MLDAEVTLLEVALQKNVGEVWSVSRNGRIVLAKLDCENACVHHVLRKSAGWSWMNDAVTEVVVEAVKSR